MKTFDFICWSHKLSSLLSECTWVCDMGQCVQNGSCMYIFGHWSVMIYGVQLYVHVHIFQMPF